jgi:EAL domain-containing protein (putative c-di-GMP-specific phosphodiesterase class I)
MRAGQILPWYQPKIDPQTMETVSVEALARWQHPVHGLIAPALFLPRIDETGLGEELLCTMLEHSVRDCCEWDTEFPALKLGWLSISM